MFAIKRDTIMRGKGEETNRMFDVRNERERVKKSKASEQRLMAVSKQQPAAPCVA
jgi:hypothetical protein